ncbi:MAG: hypothetical protein ACRETA_14355 [Gammaproteobacteria bacterium]
MASGESGGSGGNGNQLDEFQDVLILASPENFDRVRVRRYTGGLFNERSEKNLLDIDCFYALTFSVGLLAREAHKNGAAPGISQSCFCF